jgi:hypothetical protein
MEAIAEVALKASASMCSSSSHFAHRRTAVLHSNQHLFQHGLEAGIRGTPVA